MKQRIAFQLPDGEAAIVKRAATYLHLTVITRANGVFVVELNEAIDAYRLADLTVTDPAWALGALAAPADD